MDLFDNLVDPSHNYLPEDGCVNYHGVLLEPSQAENYLQRLLSEVSWVNDESYIMGKRIVTKRKVAWHADQAFEYRYSGSRKIAQPWLPVLQELKRLTESACGEQFNACLLNLYHSGDEGMAWHSDAEKELKPDAAIASLSFGAERKFSFKHKRTKQSVSLRLQAGSLLVMRGATQQHWLHRLPPTKTVHEARVNLTFRQMLAAP